MHIVIDIPEEAYEYFNEGLRYRDDVEMAIMAIVDGTPLPKVRGRLLILSEDRVKENQINLDWSCQKWISEVGLSNATVKIIKADKGE